MTTKLEFDSVNNPTPYAIVIINFDADNKGYSVGFAFGGPEGADLSVAETLAHGAAALIHHVEPEELAVLGTTSQFAAAIEALDPAFVNAPVAGEA
jgi:hypothetical protein